MHETTTEQSIGLNGCIPSRIWMKRFLSGRNFWIALGISLLYLIMITLLCFLLLPSSLLYSLDETRIPECPFQSSELNSTTTTTKSNYNDCELINLAVVCGGFNSTRNFHTLLKSILFYRVGARINLHLFVDEVSHTILRELFRTWLVPDLGVTYYNMTDYEGEIAWIGSSHYSHRYGLLKLVVPSVLSDKGLKWVAVLDTDMMMMGNIRDLWAQRSALAKSDAFLALVENQSDWYMDTRSWPAKGRGFNTGMILIDLDKLERGNWSELWRQVAERELISQLFTTLADQDIFNAVIKSHSWIEAKLPCQYNIQLNENTQIMNTCPRYQRRSFNLIHWNSPHKFAVKSDLSEYFKSWYKVFRDWNGRLLERDGCPTVPQLNDISRQEEIQDDAYINPMSHDLGRLCQDIKPGPYERVRTLLYFWGEFELYGDESRRMADGKYDVTLSVQLSIDRLHALDELASHWPGPISAAIYLPEAETSELAEMIRLSTNLSKRRNIGVHLAFKDRGMNYPINTMRNLALNNTLTPFVFILDVDFLPSKNLYSYLKSTITEIRESWGFWRESKRTPADKLALVIPAFETSEYKFEFPESKTKLKEQFDLAKVRVFRQDIWPKGQLPTDYHRWWQESILYTAYWKRHYEPYIVTTQNVSRFDERFVGFGWNKVEHINLLAAQGYEFVVLPEAFIIHKAHPASNDIIKHRNSSRYRACTRRLEIDFNSELHDKYPAFYEREFGYHPNIE